MNKLALALLFGMGLSLVTASSVEAKYPYYPAGWYVPQGSYWVQWHGYREVYTPPSATVWRPNPLYPRVKVQGGSHAKSCAAGPMVRMQFPAVLPPRPAPAPKKGLLWHWKHFWRCEYR